MVALLLSLLRLLLVMIIMTMMVLVQSQSFFGDGVGDRGVGIVFVARERTGEHTFGNIKIRCAITAENGSKASHTQRNNNSVT